MLSIIITSHSIDRLSDIQRLLDSIKTQSGDGTETIFVAERSHALFDRVRRHAHENNIPGVQVVFNDGDPGLSAGRNVGIEAASGDILAFVDDDTVLFPEWSQRIVEAYESESVIGVTGPAFPLWEDESTGNWFPRELYWIITCTAWSEWDEPREVRNAWGMNMSFRREAFEQCGLFSNEFGYHKGPMAEDNEFSLRVRQKTGRPIVYSPEAKVWHHVHAFRVSTRFIRERSYWIGRSRRMMRDLYPALAAEKDLLKEERQLLRRILTRLLPDIVKGLFIHPVNSWRKLVVTVTAILFVGLGYYSHLLPTRLGKRG